MPHSDSNLVLAPLVIQGLPEGQCFTSFEDLLRSLTKFLSVAIPLNITNVVVSNIQPTDNQRTNVWLRIGNDGNFVGAFLYAIGQWRQIFPQPNGVFWFYGNSAQIPEGYLLVNLDNPHFTSTQVGVIQQQFIPPGPLEPYTYYAATYEGF